MEKGWKELSGEAPGNAGEPALRMTTMVNQTTRRSRLHSKVRVASCRVDDRGNFSNCMHTDQQVKPATTGRAFLLEVPTTTALMRGKAATTQRRMLQKKL